MALPTSGPLSLTDIQGEFGGSNPISLSEYYAGGGLVPPGTTGTYGAVPSSGEISIQNFYGTANFSPSTNTYTTGTGVTETVPSGATSCAITVDGAGGGGGYNSTTAGGGGGGGSRSVQTIAVTGGNTFIFTVAVGGNGRASTNGSGIAGGASPVSGTVSGGSVSINAGGGAGVCGQRLGGVGGAGDGVSASDARGALPGTRGDDAVHRDHPSRGVGAESREPGLGGIFARWDGWGGGEEVGPARWGAGGVGRVGVFEEDTAAGEAVAVRGRGACARNPRRW